MTILSTTEAVIFDLDGTLVDSREDIIAAFNHGLQVVGAAAIPEAEIQSLIGTPLKEMYERRLPGADPESVGAACDAYRGYYFEHCADHTRPFPGVPECLSRLAPIPLAVATTKKTFMAVQLLERLDLAERFALIQGTDDIPPKPDPAVLLLSAATLGVRPGRCWMVGDTVHDIAAAKRAGMKSCAVTYGTSGKSELEKADPLLVVEDLMDFARHLI
jgi:phosphoglycolate phosphatase